MKKVTKPAEKEEASYYSDFSGKLFGETGPPIELNINFHYGSWRDGASIVLHLDDKDIQPVLELIKNKISPSTKKDLKKKLKKDQKYFDESMQFRDWDVCDFISNDMSLVRELLGIVEDVE